MNKQVIREALIDKRRQLNEQAHQLKVEYGDVIEADRRLQEYHRTSAYIAIELADIGQALLELGTEGGAVK